MQVIVLEALGLNTLTEFYSADKPCDLYIFEMFLVLLSSGRLITWRAPGFTSYTAMSLCFVYFTSHKSLHLTVKYCFAHSLERVVFPCSRSMYSSSETTKHRKTCMSSYF